MSSGCRGVEIGFVGLGYVKVAILGVVQGVTELLPISSTAHMRVVPALLGWPDPGAAFSAAMQSAALLAVLSYFWRDVSGLAGGSVKAVARGQFNAPEVRFVGLIVLATIPIVIAGVLLAPILNACNSPLRSIPAIGVACLIMALLLALAELVAKHRRSIDETKLSDALLVGLAQMGALIPGVSRSGSTLTAAFALGFKREDAARLSFLLGVPAIALAGAREFWELHKIHLSSHGWSVLAVGLLTGAISSFVTIWGLMRFLEKFSAWPFIIYRALLGALLIAGWMRGVLA